MLRVLYVVVMFALTLSATEIEYNKQYQGPVKLSATNYGVAFGLSAGWSAQMLSEKGPLFLSKEESSMQVVMHVETLDSSKVTAYLDQQFHFDSGVELFPMKGIRTLSSHLYRRTYLVNGSDFTSESVIYVTLGPQQRSVVMTGFYAPEESNMMDNFMLSMANSISFTPIRQLSGKTTPFASELAGMYLVFYEKTAGYSEKRELWLCRDKQFLFKSFRTVGSKTSRVAIQEQGNWKVEEDILQLFFATGAQMNYRLRKEQGRLMLNNQKSYQLKNTLCR